MNLKVTFTFIATDDDWNLSELLEGCNGINTESAKEIIKNALMEDPAYVLNLSSISVKEDLESV